jgi:hypothetical protein
MEFTKKLFELTAVALPEITTRKFSTYLGKSEGYYGSICTQKLNIPTNSLIFLSELLDKKYSENPNPRIKEVQFYIAQEIAQRMNFIETKNLVVRNLILKSIANICLKNELNYSAPPIIIT